MYNPLPTPLYVITSVVDLQDISIYSEKMLYNTWHTFKNDKQALELSLFPVYQRVATGSQNVRRACSRARVEL